MLTLADGQLAATKTSIGVQGQWVFATGIGVGEQQGFGSAVSLSLYNTSASNTETILIKLLRNGSTTERVVARAVLSPNESCDISALCLGPGDTLYGQTTDATTVDYTVFESMPGAFQVVCFDSSGNIKQVNGSTISGATTITSTSANAFDVGPNGATNPTIQTDASTASAATGLKIKSAAAASGLALSVVSSGTNEGLTVDAKGSGTIVVGNVSTGNVQLGATANSLILNNSTGVVTVALGGITVTSGNLLLSSGTGTVTSNSATALTAGRLGATTPAFQVDASTATSITGVKVKSAASGNGVAVSAIGETNVAMTINANGSGTITIGGTSTGNVLLTGGGGIVVVTGTLTAGGLTTCAVQVATAGPLIYSGSGVPSISAAVKGSLYLRSDGSSTSTRAYIATDAAGTWTAITTAA